MDAAKLLFEIWRGEGWVECSTVSADWDRLREADGVLMHRFEAETTDEAMRQHYGLQGWGDWKSTPGVTDQPFPENEAAVQQAYLLTRKLSFSTT